MKKAYSIKFNDCLFDNEEIILESADIAEIFYNDGYFYINNTDGLQYAAQQIEVIKK